MELSEIFFVFFGLAMLYAPVEIGRDFRRMKSRTATTQGIVVGHVAEQTSHWSGSASSRHTRTHHARIVFEVEGKAFECTSSVGASWIIHTDGELVDVCYDPNDPSNADVASGRTMDLLYKSLMYGFPIFGVAILLTVAIRVFG